VKDVELGNDHRVERPFNDADRLEVAAHVDHEPAPAEARGVVDIDFRHTAPAVTDRDQLQERLHAVHGANICSGSQSRLS